MEAAQKHWILPWKGLDFRAPGQQNPSNIDPQTHKNAKVEIKCSRETSREAVETDFGPQDNDFRGQESDFGNQNGGPSRLDADFGDRTAERARLIAKLDYDGYSWSTEKFSYAGHP